MYMTDSSRGGAPITEILPTIRALLALPELRLRLASDLAALEPGALDAPLRWVHSSDLADPTPFLADDLLLLTTGTQFVTEDRDEDDPAPYRDYVARLRTHGVRGLGFGTEVVRSGIPPALVEACRAEGLPLFEVPYRTPFIAIARANAEAVAARAFSRRAWSLAAQHAISLAALRPDGLGSAISELSRQLGAWVGLFDARGVLAHSFPAEPRDRAVGDALLAEVGATLRRGSRTASAFAIGGQRVELQTLGRGGELRGLLAIVGADLDAEARGVVTSVVAMAELALEQGTRLRHAHAALRAGLLRALLNGDTDLAREVSGELWGPLPEAPLTVAVVTIARERTLAAVDWLELRSAEDRGSLFHADTRDGMVLLVPAGRSDLLIALAELFDAAVGASEPAEYSAIPAAYRQALTARQRARPGVVERFADDAAVGLLAALGSPAVRALAESHLAPLRTYDAAHATRLAHTVRTWLACDARIDEAARVLGVHRHTVRARIALAEQTLGSDLSSFPVRAELWAAFVASPEDDVRAPDQE